MHPSPATRSTRRQGFTLVELMVSVAILSLLVVLLGGVFGQVSKAWISGEGDIERRRTSRGLTDYISNELRGAVVPVEQTATPAGNRNLQFLINPPETLVPAEFANADSIFWQAPIATETSFGDLAEVGYFVKWETSNPARVRPQLCRMFVNPSVSSGANEHFLIYRNPIWLSGTLLKAVAPAVAPDYRGLFAENVLGFWVRAYQPDGVELLSGGKKQFDSRKGYTFTNAHGTKEDRFLPSYVTVSFAQLDSLSAHHLTARWEAIQALSKEEGVRDAGDFLARVREEARNSPGLAPLLPSLRIYSTQVRLENAP